MLRMPKIQVMSDLHLECHKDHGESFLESIDLTAPILVLAGDITCFGVEKALRVFIKGMMSLKNRGLHSIVYVLGNHEYYKSSPEEVDLIIDKLHQAPELKNFLHILKPDQAPTTIMGIKFWGGTMWFKEPNDLEIQSILPDYHLIENFQPWVYEENTKYLQGLSRLNQGEVDIIISHHMPSYYFTPERFRTPEYDCIGQGFYTEITYEVGRVSPKVHIFGHIHEQIDLSIGRTRYVCNPLGYPHESQISTFIHDFQIVLACSEKKDNNQSKFDRDGQLSIVDPAIPIQTLDHMPKSIAQLAAVLTTSGGDGAASAAWVLSGLPANSLILVTSQFALAKSIDLALFHKAKEIYICGVGIADVIMDQLKESLKRAKAQKINIAWYCGREYLNLFAPELSSFCHLEFHSSESNFHCIKKVIKSPVCQEGLLDSIALGRVQDGEQNSREDQDELIKWSEMLNGAFYRFFNFHDMEPYLSLIKVLAGHDDLREYHQDLRRYSGLGHVLIGKSTPMKALKRKIKKVSSWNEPVLILGETGTGKELVAHSIHEGSSRHHERFLPINCSILSGSDDLASDRLFGHDKGAFTGAQSSGQGAFELADGGTLFLDEVAELPLSVQAQLLRTLETGQVIPLGSVQTRLTVDVRIIAATCKNLPEMVREGKFRQDLFHRLYVLHLETPPLRDCKEDLPAISKMALSQFKKDFSTMPKIKPEDWDMINEYTWPGNVRQFIHSLKRAAILEMSVAEVIQDEKRILGDDGLLDHEHRFNGFPQRKEDVMSSDVFNQAYVKHCLELFEDNKSATAKALGISINTLKSRL